MPSINDSRKTITATIPSIPGSSVELWDTLTVGDSEKIHGEENKVTQGLMSVFCLLKSWNLDEELTFENLKKIGLDDFQALIGKTTYGKSLKMSAEEREDIEVEKKSN